MYVTDRKNTPVQKFDGSFVEKESAADEAENITYPQWALDAEEAVGKLGLLEEAYTDWQTNVMATITEKGKMEGAYDVWQGKVTDTENEFGKMEAAYGLWQEVVEDAKDKESQKNAAYLTLMEEVLDAERGFEGTLDSSNPLVMAYGNSINGFEGVLSEYQGVFNGNPGSDYVSLRGEYYNILDQYNDALILEEGLRNKYYSALSSYQTELGIALRAEELLKTKYNTAWEAYKLTLDAEKGVREAYLSALGNYNSNPSPDNKAALEAAYDAWNPLAIAAEDKRKALTGYYDDGVFYEGAYQEWLSANEAVRSVSNEDLISASDAWQLEKGVVDSLKKDLDDKYLDWEAVAKNLVEKKIELDEEYSQVSYLRDEILQSKQSAWNGILEEVESKRQVRESALAKAVTAYNILQLTDAIVGERSADLEGLETLLSQSESLVKSVDENYQLGVDVRDRASVVFQDRLTEKDNALADLEAKRRLYDDAESSYTQAAIDSAAAEGVYQAALVEQENAYSLFESAVGVLTAKAMEVWDESRGRFSDRKRSLWDEQEASFAANKGSWVTMMDESESAGLEYWDRVADELGGNRDNWRAEFDALVDGKLLELNGAEEVFVQQRGLWKNEVLTLEAQLGNRWDDQERGLKSKRNAWNKEALREFREAKARLNTKIGQEMISFQREAELAAQEEIERVKGILEDEIVKQFAAKLAELKSGWDGYKAGELRDLEYSWEQSWRTLQDLQRASEAFVDFNFSREEVGALSGGAPGGVVEEWDELKELLESAAGGLRNNLLKMADEELSYLEGIEDRLKEYGFAPMEVGLDGADEINDTKSLLNLVEGVIETKKRRISEFLVVQIGEGDLEEGLGDFLVRAELLRQAEEVLVEKGYSLPAGTVLAREESIWILQSELELSEIRGIVDEIAIRNSSLGQEKEELSETVDKIITKIGEGDEIKIDEIESLGELLESDPGSTEQLAELVAEEIRLEEEAKKIEEEVALLEDEIGGLVEEQNKLNEQSKELEEEEARLREEKGELSEETLALEAEKKELEEEKDKLGEETAKLEAEKDDLLKQRLDLGERTKALEEEKARLESKALMMAESTKALEEILESWRQESLNQDVLRELTDTLLQGKLLLVRGLEKELEKYGHEVVNMLGIESLEDLITNNALTFEERKDNILAEIDKLVVERLGGVRGYLLEKGYELNEYETGLGEWQLSISDETIDFLARMKLVKDELDEYGLRLDEESLDRFKDVND